MAKGTDFEGANRTFGAPRGEEDRVSSLSIFDNGVTYVSCWELNDDELAEVARTGQVWLSVWSRVLYPAFVGSETRVREINADHGLWPKVEREQIIPADTKLPAILGVAKRIGGAALTIARVKNSLAQLPKNEGGSVTMSDARYAVLMDILGDVATLFDEISLAAEQDAGG